MVDWLDTLAAGSALSAEAVSRLQDRGFVVLPSSVLSPRPTITRWPRPRRVRGVEHRGTCGGPRRRRNQPMSCPR
jgi:hypothetical protein